jgi:erythromycin esterase
MTHAQAAAQTAALDRWIARDSIPFRLDSPAGVDAAIDRTVAALGESVEVLGIGEPLHGGEEFLVLRNRLFERLVTAHGYTAIAIESSFPKGLRVNEYVRGDGPGSYDDIQESGFGHNSGKLEANRELVEWMRRYNEGGPRVSLRFYGFDMPTAPTGIAGPRAILPPALDFLAAVDEAASRALRERATSLMGEEADWENPAAYFDPSKSIGLSPQAGALRLAIEYLIGELLVRRPELIDAGGGERYAEALQHAVVARGLLNYHAAIAGKSGLGTQLGIRDAMMADNLFYIAARERSRGKVLVFAHNAHLQRGKIAAWEAWRKAMNAPEFSWWPAGSHLDRLLGPRYAAIGSAVGESPENGIAAAEPGSIEARLAAAIGSPDSLAGLFLPTRTARDLPQAEISSLPSRSVSTTNLSYIPLGPQSLTDFDAWAMLNRATYLRGGPPRATPAVETK